MQTGVDLAKLSDRTIFRVVAQEQPGFIDILWGEIEKGRDDQYIIRNVCLAGGSPQAMRYAKRCLSFLRATLREEQAGLTPGAADGR